MPTSTFLNLKKDKQDIIIEASLREFARASLHDASINKIIKDANISRGSFYNYFSDINDLYFYAINSYKDKFIDLTHKSLKMFNGDIIASTLFVFDKTLVYADTVASKSLVKNIFLNINYNIGIEKEILKHEVDNQYRLVEIISLINRDNLNLNGEEDLFYIIDMIVDIVVHGLKEVFVNDRDSLIIKDKIERQLRILEVGIKKEDK